MAKNDNDLDATLATFDQKTAGWIEEQLDKFPFIIDQLSETASVGDGAMFASVTSDDLMKAWVAGTPMAESLFVSEMGKDAKLAAPESIFAFRDHLTFLDLIMPKAHVAMGLKEQAA
mgnify:CR=1 FL=1